MLSHAEHRSVDNLLRVLLAQRCLASTTLRGGVHKLLGMLGGNYRLQPLREVLRLLQQQPEPRGRINIGASIDDAYGHRRPLWAASAFDSNFDD